MLLGIDIGGSRLKIGVYAFEGKLVAFENYDYSLTSPRRGWMEANPELWWNTFLKMLKKMAKKIRLKEIEAIGVSCTNATLGIDKNGRILLPAVMFMDQRSIEECEYIADRIDSEKIQKITGNRIMPGTCSAPTILWAKSNKKTTYERIYKFMVPSTYFVYKLTGKFAIDRSRATPTLLYDIRANEWSKELCEAIGIDMSKLPPIYDSDEVVETLTRTSAQETGLDKDTVVVTGGTDTSCAALGMGIAEFGKAGEDSGTAAVLFVDSQEPLMDHRVMNIAHVIKGHWLAVAPMSHMGRSLEWFKDEFGIEKRKIAEKNDKDIYDLLCKEAASSPPGANGMIFLPYLLGDRAPIWDTDARGVFFGFSSTHKRSDFIKAILESAGFGIRWNIEIIEKKLQSSIKQIIAVGGHSRSSLWTQIKSDITSKNYAVPEGKEAATLGAAILAGKGLGIYGDIAGIGQEFSLTKKVFVPNENLAKTYQAYFDLYKRVYFDLRADFKTLSQIRGMN